MASVNNNTYAFDECSILHLFIQQLLFPVSAS